MKKTLLSFLTLALVCAAISAGGQRQTVGTQPIQLSIQDYLTADHVNDLFDSFYVMFQERYPNVTFERESYPFGDHHQRLLSRTMARDLTDIIMVNNFDIPYIGDAGALRRLNELIEQWGQWDDFFPGSQEATTWNDDILAIHSGTNNLALFMNPELLEEAGLSGDPETWDDLLHFAETLTRGNTYGLAVSANNTELLPWQLKPFLWTNGGDMMNLDRPESIEALQLWVTLVERGWMSRDIVNWDQGDLTAQFRAKRAAMMVQGPWEIPRLVADNIPFRIVTIPTPRPGMIPKVAMGGETWGLNPFIDDQRAELGFEFIKTMVSEEGMYAYCKMQGYVPTRKSVIDRYITDHPLLRPFADQLPQATRSEPEKRLDYNAISTAARPSIQAALIGQLTAEEAMRQAANRVREVTR